MVWGILCCLLAMQTKKPCVVKRQESICGKLVFLWSVCLFCRLVLFNCSAAELIDKFVCQKILLIEDRDECSLLITTVFNFILLLLFQMNALDTLGQTALHRAALAGHLQTCRLLLSYGSDPSIISLQGFTAAQMGNEAVQQILSGG